MDSSANNVLVFGPTGAVGCAAALEAHRRGAHVWLAMRDTNKSIKGLNDSEGRYTRVQADLSKPETLADAVKKSNAKAAFVYTLFKSPDNMASSFAALKDAGISYIVLLSSMSIQGSPDTQKDAKDFIPRVHARTELALKASGIAYTAIRPMYFNSNVLWYVPQIKRGKVDLLYPDAKFDYLSPSDIGAVAGAVLANPAFQHPPNSDRAIYVCGPELMSQEQAFGVMAKTLGREIKVNPVGVEQWKSHLSWMRESTLDTLAESMKASHEAKGPSREHYGGGLYDEGVKNIRKYKEAEPMSFGEWVAANKDAFA